ncbi:MAG: GTP cyclohydrolase I FolE [Bdellovibrionales bacterium]|nr:GTP cyclohydrolase I FolE [Bdellovibrionales bacterium]
MPSENELHNQSSLQALESSCKTLLHEIGEDVAREGLLKTPERFARSFLELTSGYNLSVKDTIGDAIFDESGSEMVIVRDIEFYSLCEHHILPFFGRAHVAYIPNGKIVGLSKIPRIVNIFARRLQVQERLTSQIADALLEFLQPSGVACVIEASHLCMMMRGVQSCSSSMVTNCMRGVFLDDAKTRSEFLHFISHK